VYSLLILAVSSFCVAFILTPLCRNLAIRWGLVDQPDQIRKLHTRPIPRIGSISIFHRLLDFFRRPLFFTCPYQKVRSR
jgi:UDP-N-acetylmuramyl pentapeptide phosphotransferase/UDP-N-acetylglucosamine-1-phosphate transferase